MAHAVEAWSDDGELVEAILGGSREHFDLLYQSYFPRVYRFALKRLGDPGEAEDVAQEVFMTVFRVLPSFQGDSTLLTWIFGITRNTVNRRFRRQPCTAGAPRRRRRGRRQVSDEERAPGSRAPTRAASWIAAKQVIAKRPDAAPAAHLPPEAPAPAVHPQHRRGPRQVRGCGQGQPLPHAPRPPGGRAGPGDPAPALISRRRFTREPPRGGICLLSGRKYSPRSDFSRSSAPPKPP